MISIPAPATTVNVSLLVSAIIVDWVATAIFLNIFCAEPGSVFVTVYVVWEPTTAELTWIPSAATTINVSLAVGKKVKKSSNVIFLYIQPILKVIVNSALLFG